MQHCGIGVFRISFASSNLIARIDQLHLDYLWLCTMVQCVVKIFFILHFPVIFVHLRYVDLLLKFNASSCLFNFR
ncbi:hypothetical protein Pint_15806 [Pistacia integerrima]|uniref:Uncharacterized protein n=1 Tax=Pistacia integerrima TaxID=434235 RepID=A0ACC0ZGY0_9ROSI|nr:hypothetical protein Pint_15806 [Pistacia integerrima]